MDNGSTDDTRAIAEERAEALPIRVVDAPDKQAAFYARNVGAAASTGGSLLFLDHDDVIAPGYLEAMRSALGTSDIVAGRLDVRALNAEWAVESRPEPVAEGLFDHFGFLPYAPSCALGVGRAVFGELGGFADVPFAEDVDFCWRAQLAGKRICSVPEALVHYRYRSTLRAILAKPVATVGHSRFSTGVIGTSACRDGRFAAGPPTGAGLSRCSCTPGADRRLPGSSSSSVCTSEGSPVRCATGSSTCEAVSRVGRSSKSLRDR